MPLYKTDAINIRSFNIGEADKLITLFSREYGKIKAVAKGARRTASKFGGRLEVFSYNKLLLATGKSLDIISQCETIESFYRLREDAGRLRTGLYFIKLVDLTTEERQSNEGLFDLLLNSLMILRGFGDLNRLERYFEVKLVEVEGLFPNLGKMKVNSRLKSAIDGLKANDIDVEYDKEPLKGVENMFRRIIGEHIGRDLNKIDTGNF